MQASRWRRTPATPVTWCPSPCPLTTGPLSPGPVMPLPRYVMSLSLSPDNRTFVSGACDASAKVRHVPFLVPWHPDFCQSTWCPFSCPLTSGPLRLGRVRPLPGCASSVGDPWHFGAYPDPWLCMVPLTNGSGSGSNSGSDSILHWFEVCKKNYFFHIFSHNLPTGTI